jgi:hypothetical protein
LLSPAGIKTWKIGGLGRQPVYTKLTNDYIMESYDESAKDKRIVRAKDWRGQKVFRDYGFRISGI